MERRAGVGGNLKERAILKKNHPEWNENTHLKKKFFLHIAFQLLIQGVTLLACVTKQPWKCKLSNINCFKPGVLFLYVFDISGLIAHFCLQIT